MTSWSKPLEVDRLADEAAELDFEVPLAELSGTHSLGVEAGTVRGRAQFAREQGRAIARLTLSGSVTLKCQRCMQPLQLPLEAQTRIALVTSEAQAAEVPADLEPMLAAGGRISIGELITEELLLSLPVVPLHDDGAACAGAGEASAAHERAGETHRPFARLGELLKR